VPVVGRSSWQSDVNRGHTDSHTEANVHRPTWYSNRIRYCGGIVTGLAKSFCLHYIACLCRSNVLSSPRNNISAPVERVERVSPTLPLLSSIQFTMSKHHHSDSPSDGSSPRNSKTQRVFMASSDADEDEDENDSDPANNFDNMEYLTGLPNYELAQHAQELEDIRLNLSQELEQTQECLRRAHRERKQLEKELAIERGKNRPAATEKVLSTRNLQDKADTFARMVSQEIKKQMKWEYVSHSLSSPFLPEQPRTAMH